MKKQLKKAWKWVVYQYNSLHNSIMFYFKKKEAMRKWELTGLRHWVLPTSGHKLIVVNNRYIKEYNKLVERKKQLNIYDLERMAYFATPCGKLSERKQPKK